MILISHIPNIKASINYLKNKQKKAPNDIAVISRDKQLTYRELNELANQLAHVIRKEYFKAYGGKLKPDTLIGIYIDRSLEVIVSILGILKAGAAYVPIDTHDSEKRLKFKINDATLKIVLTTQNKLETFISVP